MSTPAQSKLFRYEAWDLIGSTTVHGTAYGIAFTLYCLCARSLYVQMTSDPNKRRQAKFTIGYITLLFLFMTVGLAMSSRMIQLAYIIHSDFPGNPGGPLAYESLHNLPNNAIHTVEGVLDLITKVSIMGIQVYIQPNILRSTSPNTLLLDLASADHMEHNAVCCCHHGFAAAINGVLLRYVILTQ